MRPRTLTRFLLGPSTSLLLTKEEEIWHLWLAVWTTRETINPNYAPLTIHFSYTIETLKQSSIEKGDIFEYFFSFIGILK